MFGTAKTVKVTKDNFLIVDGAGDKAAIDARVAQIKAELERVDSDFDREKAQERLCEALRRRGRAEVGAATESELKEKKSRIEDALQATRAAVEEGIVAGGGVALVNAIPAPSTGLRATPRRWWACPSSARPSRPRCAPSPRTLASRGSVEVAEVKKAAAGWGRTARPASRAT